jgi:hypothetical protein
MELPYYTELKDALLIVGKNGWTMVCLPATQYELMNTVQKQERLVQEWRIWFQVFTIPCTDSVCHAPVTPDWQLVRLQLHTKLLCCMRCREWWQAWTLPRSGGGIARAPQWKL